MSGVASPTLPQQEEIRFQAIYANAALGIAECDANGAWLRVNPRFCAMLGFTEAELRQRTVDDLTHPEDLPDLRLGLMRLGTGHIGTYRNEKRCLRRGGDQLWVAITVSALRTPSGELDRFICFAEDISARKAAETRLRELISTLDLASVFVRAFDGRIQFWSKGCEHLYGWSAEEAIGEDFRTLLRVSYLTPPAEIETVLLTNGAWSGDLIHHRRDGEKLTIAARKVLRREADGSPAAVMENVSDVSALRSAQAELLRLNESLAVRVQMEVTARETAQLMLAHAQRMQALGQLAGGIAHDFNNVIQAVDGAAALIEIRSPNAELRRLSGIIRDASHRGAAVTRRLLTFARRGELHAERFDMAALLGGFPEMLQGALGAGIAVTVSLPPDLPSVFADRAQLETVLVNLATNARDALPAGGTIALSASRVAVAPEDLPPGTYIRLDIADTGCGMEADILQRAMEPFFTTKPIGEGTGLGLSMAKGFAEQSGGCITIRSAPGEGTCVSLFLPAHEMAQSGADTVAPPPLLRADAHILLVDDEELVREVVSEHLAEHGYTVSVADSGESALTLLGKGLSPDLMISDYAMPGMNGLSLIRSVQQSHPRMPCLMLTGYAGDAADLLKGTSVSLLGKPVTATALLTRVASLLPPDRHSAAA